MEGAIRPARPQEAERLTALTHRSKAHWGYPPELMDGWAEALSLTADDIAQNPTHLLEQNGAVIGYYALAHYPHPPAEYSLPTGPGWWLSHLYVEPAAIGGGAGAALFAHAAQTAAALGAERFYITSDPNAVGFYTRMGARWLCDKPSNIEGRTQPVFECPVSAAPPPTGGMPRRLLVVSQHFWPENFRINDMVAGLVAKGVEVDVLCGLPNYPAGEWFAGYSYGGPRRQRQFGAEVFRAGEIRRKGNTSLRIFLNYCSWPLFALFSLPRLAGRRYSAVLCYETSPVMMLLPAILYAKTHRTPLAAYVLDLWPDNLYSVLPVKHPFLRKIASAVSNWHYRRCDKLIALGEGQAEKLRGAVYTAKRQPEISIIPQYAEDFYAEDAEDEALKRRFAGAFNILFTGNLSPAQDLENLINAMALVRAEPDGADVRVRILGDGMSRQHLQNAVQAAGLGEVIEFCGSVPPTEIPRWTGAAQALFAGLAKSENLGLTLPAKIPAYLAAGKPLLVADDGEGGRTAAASGAALVSDAGDAGALAANILALRRRPAAERAAMGAAGRAWYKQHYNRDTLLAKLEECLFDT